MMRNLDEPRKDVIPLEQRSRSGRERGEAFLPQHQVEDMRSRWAAIQSSFVDEPRKSVEAADRLVADAIKQIEEVFFAERADLEKEWARGEEVSTEHLRVSLRRYREFFDRLLAMTDVKNP
jgi:hypothetical protein